MVGACEANSVRARERGKSGSEADCCKELHCCQRSCCML